MQSIAKSIAIGAGHFIQWALHINKPTYIKGADMNTPNRGFTAVLLSGLEELRDYLPTDPLDPFTITECVGDTDTTYLVQGAGWQFTLLFDKHNREWHLVP